LQFEGV